MSRKACCSGEGLKKGAWTTEEDKKLISYIHQHGEGGWRDVPQKAGLKRCGKSCRLRWTNYLKPDIKRGEFSEEEEQIIIMLHASRGNKWSVIARHLPRRTDNEIKNYWNTHLKKRLIERGIDPVTHKPLGSNPSPSTPDNSNSNSNSQNTLSPDDHSRSSSISPRPHNNIPHSSNLEITNDDATKSGFLNRKNRPSRPNFTSSLLNKVATRATSMRGILSASVGGGSTAPSPSSSLPFAHTEPYQYSSHASMAIDENELQATENLDVKGGNLLYGVQDYEFPRFLDEFGQYDEVKDYDFDYSFDHHMISDVSQDVSSTTVDDDMISPVDGWSDYILDDHPNNI